jgi:hypothetical protein
MTADEVVPVAAAVVGALVEAEVTMTAEQIATLQRALAPRLWPLLDRASRLLVTEEGIRQRLAEGRAVLVLDEAGAVSVWCGTFDPQEE